MLRLVPALVVGKGILPSIKGSHSSSPSTSVLNTPAQGCLLDVCPESELKLSV